MRISLRFFSLIFVILAFAQTGLAADEQPNLTASVLNADASDLENEYIEIYKASQNSSRSVFELIAQNKILRLARRLSLLNFAITNAGNYMLAPENYSYVIDIYATKLDSKQIKSDTLYSNTLQRALTNPQYFKTIKPLFLEAKIEKKQYWGSGFLHSHIDEKWSLVVYCIEKSRADMRYLDPMRTLLDDWPLDTSANEWIESIMVSRLPSSAYRREEEKGAENRENFSLVQWLTRTRTGGSKALGEKAYRQAGVIILDKYIEKINKEDGIRRQESAKLRELAAKSREEASRLKADAARIPSGEKRRKRVLNAAALKEKIEAEGLQNKAADILEQHTTINGQILNLAAALEGAGEKLTISLGDLAKKINNLDQVDPKLFSATQNSVMKNNLATLSLKEKWEALFKQAEILGK